MKMMNARLSIITTCLFFSCGHKSTSSAEQQNQQQYGEGLVQFSGMTGKIKSKKWDGRGGRILLRNLRSGPQFYIEISDIEQPTPCRSNAALSGVEGTLNIWLPRVIGTHKLIMSESSQVDGDNAYVRRGSMNDGVPTISELGVYGEVNILEITDKIVRGHIVNLESTEASWNETKLSGDFTLPICNSI